MTAIDLLNRILDAAPWVDRANTVDHIIDGRPDKELKKVLVVWRCSKETLDFAVREGYDGIWAHEPTYHFHKNEAAQLAAAPNDSPKKETALHKQRVILENDLVVMRIHDSWDSRDDIGVAACWAKSLGLTNRVQKSVPLDCECRYDLPASTTTGALLNVVKEAVKGYQIPQPVLFGGQDLPVSRVGIGAGCIANVEKFIKMGCEIAIVCDDGLWYWSDIAFAIDRGFPVIRVSHAATEEAGMQALANWIRTEFGLEVMYQQEPAFS